MPVEIFLELGHCHLVGSLGWLLSTWGWHSRGLLLSTWNGSLSWDFASNSSDWSTLLRSLLSAWGLVRSILNNLVDALSYISWFSRFLASSSLLFFGSGLCSSLPFALSTTLNLGLSLSLRLWWSFLEFFIGVLSFLLNVNVLNLEDGSVTFLEWEICEFITLACTALNNSTIYFTLLSCLIDSQFWNIRKWLLFGCLSDG